MTTHAVFMRVAMFVRVPPQTAKPAPKQTQSHQCNQSARNKTEYGKEALRKKISRCKESCESECKHADCMSDGNGQTEKRSMPRRAARSNQVRTHNGFAVARRKRVGSSKNPRRATVSVARSRGEDGYGNELSEAVP